MQVTCIKCNKIGSLGINQSTSNGHVYKYYMIQHYDSETKKHSWCYIGSEKSLPEQYKIVIHKEPQLYTDYTQNTNNPNYSAITRNNGESTRGCRLVWSNFPLLEYYNLYTSTDTVFTVNHDA